MIDMSNVAEDIVFHTQSERSLYVSMTKEARAAWLGHAIAQDIGDFHRFA